MASTYVRRFNLKGSLSDKQVSDYWKHLLGVFVPAIQKVKGSELRQSVFWGWCPSRRH